MTLRPYSNGGGWGGGGTLEFPPREKVESLENRSSYIEEGE